MKNIERVIYGVVITALIYFTALMVSHWFPLNSIYLPDLFITLTINFLLSVAAIFMFRKYLTFDISVPELRLSAKLFA